MPEPRYCPHGVDVQLYGETIYEDGEQITRYYAKECLKCAEDAGTIVICNLPFERVPTSASDPGTVPKNDN